MVQTSQDIWKKCLSDIRKNIGQESTYKAYFEPIKFCSFSNNKLQLSVPNRLLLECIEGNYKQILQNSILHYYGNVKIIWTEEASKRGTQIEEPLDARIEHKVLDFDSNLTHIYSFDNFIEGKCNKLSRSIALSIAQKSYNKTFNPFFLYGPSGVGKTHLANAIGLKVNELFPEKRVLYVTANLLQIQYTDATINHKFNEFMNFYQSIDLLIVDDIQEFAGKVKTQEAFFNIFNHLHLNQRQLVITCDKPPVQLEGITERLLSRFKWGMIAELEHPDTKLRKDILNYHIKRDGLQISQTIINYIASHINTSIRDLEGIINSMMAYSITNDCEMDLDLAKKVVSRIVCTERQPLTMEFVLDKVCKFYSLKTQDIVSSSRKRDVVIARQIAMYLIQKHTKTSSIQIGNRLGRDHSTVLHSCKEVDTRLNVEKQLRHDIETIEKSFYQK